MNRLSCLLTWFALPVYIAQGMRVRMTRPRLAPPEGRHSGLVPGKGKPVRLLVLGDSSAATVGADSVEHSIAHNLASRIGVHSGNPVEWRAAGFNSATSLDLRDHVVPNLDRAQWDIIVISVGTNDAKNWRTISGFRKSFGGMLYALRARYPDARIAWCRMIDPRLIPALPQPMANILSIRTAAMNSAGERLCRERFALALDPVPVEGPDGFSHDGFHASESGYRYWAEHVFEQLKSAGVVPLTAGD